MFIVMMINNVHVLITINTK